MFSGNNSNRPTCQHRRPEDPPSTPPHRYTWLSIPATLCGLDLPSTSTTFRSLSPRLSSPSLACTTLCNCAFVHRLGSSRFLLPKSREGDNDDVSPSNPFHAESRSTARMRSKFAACGTHSRTSCDMSLISNVGRLPSCDGVGCVGGRQTRRELEMPTVRSRKVDVGVQRTASSEGLPLIVKLPRGQPSLML